MPPGQVYEGLGIDPGPLCLLDEHWATSSAGLAFSFSQISTSENLLRANDWADLSLATCQLYEVGQVTDSLYLSCEISAV